MANFLLFLTMYQLHSYDYYPFGSPMPERSYSSPSYRYGFNGMEKDDEVKGINGASYDFGARMYDSRLGRFYRTDPNCGLYPYLTPYAFAENRPINGVDFGGLGYKITVYSRTITKTISEIVNNQTLSPVGREVRVANVLLKYQTQHFTGDQKEWINTLIKSNQISQESLPLGDVIVSIEDDGNDDNSIAVYGLVGDNDPNTNVMQEIVRWEDKYSLGEWDRDPALAGQYGSAMYDLVLKWHFRGAQPAALTTALSKTSSVLGGVGIAATSYVMYDDAKTHGAINPLDALGAGLAVAVLVATGPVGWVILGASVAVTGVGLYDTYANDGKWFSAGKGEFRVKTEKYIERREIPKRKQSNGEGAKYKYKKVEKMPSNKKSKKSKKLNYSKTDKDGKAK